MAGIPPPWSRAPSRPVQEESSRQLAACRGRLQRIRFDEFIKRLAEGDQLCYMTTQATPSGDLKLRSVAVGWAAYHVDHPPSQYRHSHRIGRTHS
jgi:hypothetical protein